jgi:hypothetical protein
MHDVARHPWPHEGQDAEHRLTRPSDITGQP